MKTLVVNCGVAIVKKYREIFDGYDEIQINAGSALFNSEVYNQLNRKKLTVNTGSSKVLDKDYEIIYLGETARLNKQTDYAGCFLIAEDLIITPEAVPGLIHVSGMMAEKIFCPDTLPAAVRKLCNAEEIIVYDADTMLEMESITLDEAYMQKLAGYTKIHVDGDIDALHATALKQAKDMGLQFTCEDLRIYAGDYAEYAGLFTAENNTLVPDGWQIAPKGDSLKKLFALYGEKVHVCGDMRFVPEDQRLLENMEGLTIEGEAYIPMDILPAFRKIGKADTIHLYEGTLWEISGAETITHEQLQAALQAGKQFTIYSKGHLSFTEDVTVQDLDAVISLSYKGIVVVKGSIQPFLRGKVTEGKGMMTDKDPAGSEESADNVNMINLGFWIVE